MNRPLADRRLGGTLGNRPSADPAGPGAGRLPPHLAVLAIGALSLGAWLMLGLLAQTLLHAL